MATGVVFGTKIFLFQGPSALKLFHVSLVIEKAALVISGEGLLP